MALFKKTKINRSVMGNALSFTFLIILGLFMAFPMVFSLNAAFKPLDELFLFPPKIFVQHPTLDNFSQLSDIMTSSMVTFSRYIFNTVFVTAVGTVGHIILSSLCAYALAKRKFPGRELIFKMIVVSLMFSAEVTVVPKYILTSELGLLDSYWAIILPAFQSSLGLYLMKQFMDGVPDSIIESAQIDGAGQFRIFIKMIMPLVKPAWLTLIIFSIQSLWNTQSSYIFSEQLKSLPQALSQISAGGIARTGVASAVSVIMMIVPILAFIITQSNVIETMSTSGMKG